jgi:uncharacterized protein YegL
MKGEAIGAVNKGLSELMKYLRADPFALETVHVSIISFNTEAELVRPFSDLLIPDSVEIEAKGQSNFGKGLDLLISQMTQNIVKSSKETKGDWRPLVFFMTDGRPSGAYKSKLKEFHTQNNGQFIICACGVKKNLNIIETMGGVVITLNAKDEISICKFFKWVSTSISCHSRSVTQNQSEFVQFEKY